MPAVALLVLQSRQQERSKQQKNPLPTLYSVLVANSERRERPAQLDAIVDLGNAHEPGTVRVAEEDVERQALAAVLRDRRRNERDGRVETFARRGRRQVEAQAARAAGLLAEEERRRELLPRRVRVGSALRQGGVRVRAAKDRMGDGEGRSDGGLRDRRCDGTCDGLAEESDGENEDGALHLVGSG